MNDNFISFDRGLLKDRAQTVMKRDYWKCFLAALVLQAFTAGLPSTGINYMWRNSHGIESGVSYPFVGSFTGFFGFLFILPFILLFAVLGIAVASILVKLIAAPLEVGGRRFFLEASQARYNLGNLGFGFSGDFFNVFKTVLLRDIFVYLWSLLLIIPGIIKHYSYYLVGFLLAENPSMDYKRALYLSSEMTRGYKFQIFVLELSFLGWLILGGLLFGVGTFFVFPYIKATETEMYLFLRARALELGILRLDELNVRGF